MTVETKLKLWTWLVVRPLGLCLAIVTLFAELLNALSDASDWAGSRLYWFTTDTNQWVRRRILGHYGLLKRPPVPRGK